MAALSPGRHWSPRLLVRAPMPRTWRGHLLRQTRKRLPLDGLLPRGRSLPPDCVYLMPALRCNLACPYCFQRDLSEPADALSIDEWQVVVKEIRALGCTVALLGGEILLYPHFLRLLAMVKSVGLPAVLITNGVLLPWYAERLVQAGLDCLIVSIDGPPPTGAHSPRALAPNGESQSGRAGEGP